LSIITPSQPYRFSSFEELDELGALRPRSDERHLAERLLVEEPDGPEAKLGMFRQTLGHRSPDVPGTDDQGRDERAAPAPRQRLTQVGNRPPARQPH